MIELPIGTAILVYLDDGPSGPSTQSVSTTCAHTAIHIFENESLMRDFLETDSFRKGKRCRFQYLVVGEGGTLGTSLRIHSAMAKGQKEQINQ